MWGLFIEKLLSARPCLFLNSGEKRKLLKGDDEEGKDEKGG